MIFQTPEVPKPEIFDLPSGLKKSSIMVGTWDITGGKFSSERPYGIKFSPGVGSPESWLSGEALILPKDKGLVFMVGRGEGVVRMDCDLMPYEDFVKEYSHTEPELVNSLRGIKGFTEEWDPEGLQLERLRFVADLGDLRISRHHLQISYHSEGALVVTYDPLLGRSYGERSERINFPTLLRQYEKRPAIEEMSWIYNNGSKTLHDGDTVIVRGAQRTYCFRYFRGSETDPTRLVKQSYSKDITVEELYPF